MTEVNHDAFWRSVRWARGGGLLARLSTFVLGWPIVALLEGKFQWYTFLPFFVLALGSIGAGRVSKRLLDSHIEQFEASHPYLNDNEFLGGRENA
jgi:hypothetical protein